MMGEPRSPHVTCHYLPCPLDRIYYDRIPIVAALIMFESPPLSCRGQVSVCKMQTQTKIIKCPRQVYNCENVVKTIQVRDVATCVFGHLLLAASPLSLSSPISSPIIPLTSLPVLSILLTTCPFIFTTFSTPLLSFCHVSTLPFFHLPPPLTHARTHTHTPPTHRLPHRFPSA